ncbi:MAG: PAS domain S-box protein, partial [Burkholderiales bacterium]|nr:PAS domain S-box protein [Burkholderiales bacterium]
MTANKYYWIARAVAGTQLDLADEALRRQEAARAEAESAAAQLEGRLQASEAERASTRGVLDAIESAYATIEFNLEGQVLRANPNFLALLGYREEEVVGKHHRMFVEAAQAAAPAYAQFWRDLNDGKAQNSVFKRITKSGAEVWIQAVYAPVRDAAGRVVKVTKIATDVTAARLQAADYEGQIKAVSKAQAVIEFGLDGKVLDANDNFLNALGYTLAEVKGQHHSLFVDPAYRASAQYRLFWDKLGRGEFESGLYKRIGKGGREVWIQASYNPIMDLSGRPFKVVKYATDVTAERIKAADYEGQINAVGKAQAVIEFSLDGKVLTANDNFLQTLGYTLAEIKGQHHSLFVDPAHRASAEYRMFWDKLGRGEFDSGLYKRIAKGGREVWIQASYNPIMDLDGKPFKVVKYATDVTAERLKAADFEGQIDAVSKAQAVIEFGLDGKVLTANDNFLRTLGYTLAEIKGQHHSLFVDPAYRASVEYRMFWDKLGRGEFDAGQYKRIGKGGKEIWIQASYNPIMDLNGKPFKVVKYATDVTAEVNANNMLRQAVEEAQQVTSAAREGDLTPRIPMQGKSGPIGELCAGVNSLMETTSLIFGDVGRVFGALAAGDLSQRIERDYSGTFGQVKADANGTSEKLASVIDDVVRVFSGLAQGDLTQRIGGDAQGVFAQVKEDANASCDKLASIIDEVRAAADALTGAANQVSATAQSLSQAASEQASSVEET